MAIRVCDAARMSDLLAAIRARGYDVVGPTMRDEVITYAPLGSVSDLPIGRGDTQGPAHYRTRPIEDALWFGYAAPVQSAKPVFFPADELLWSGRVRRGPHAEDLPEISPADTAAPRPTAFFGIRSCDVAALAQHDHILTGRLAADVHYAARRRDTLVVAATCSHPAATCFCGSMGTGPAPREGVDIAVTELLDEQGHRFVTTPMTDRGRELLDAIDAPVARADEVVAAARVEAEAGAAMGRSMETDDLVGVLYAGVESPRWDDVAARCLACGNCTLVCPTCFCTTITDVSDLTGESGERHRVWASCFTRDYSYIHGGSVRESTRARYRQWLTHKLAAWQTQFGSIGCVGCGRCITWCPAGIDITEEVAAIRSGDSTDAPGVTYPVIPTPEARP